MNMIDGIPNNEPPRVNQGYTILESETVGHMEYVLAEKSCRSMSRSEGRLSRR